MPFGDFPEDQHREMFERIAGGRQIIVKYKKGGKFKDEHVYDSSTIDRESVNAIEAVIHFCGHPDNN